MAMPNGAFEAEFAARKRWKLDQNLVSALTDAIPAGSRVIDLGAGAGCLVRALRERGYVADGVDGTPGIEEISGGTVSHADLASSSFRLPSREIYEVATCIEVGEHIPRELQQAFLENICRCSRHMLIVSWALPGQRGRDHVSCHTPEWVVAQLVRRGWHFDEEATLRARRVASKGWDRKLTVFKR